MKRILTVALMGLGLSVVTWIAVAGINPHIQEVDLDIEGVADDAEFSPGPGGFVCSNGLKQITLHSEGVNPPMRMRLNWDSAKIAVCATTNGPGTPGPFEMYWDVQSPWTTQLWVKGVAVSDSGPVGTNCGPEHMCLEAINNGSPYLYDRVGFTVIRVDSETVATTPADQTRTDIGVAEEVNLVASPSIAGGAWSLSGGGGLSPTNGPITTFTAPSNASVCTVSFNVGGISCDKVFTVVEPSGVVAAKINATRRYPAGVAAARMHLYPVVVGPTNVSFYRVRCLEVGRDATNCVGYWVTNAAPSHIGNGADVWFPLDEANQWPVSWDHAGSGWVDQPWYSGGSFEWPIPANWQIGNTGPTNSMTGWNQEFELQSNGTVTVRKWGNWVTRTTNDVITTN